MKKMYVKIYLHKGTLRSKRAEGGHCLGRIWCLFIKKNKIVYFYITLGLYVFLQLSLVEFWHGKGFQTSTLCSH